MAQETRGTHGAHETHGTRHTRFTRNKRYEQASYCGRSLFIAEEDMLSCQKGGEGRPYRTSRGNIKAFFQKDS